MKTKETLKNLAAQLATDMIVHDEEGWPPGCLGLAYQPPRPEPRKEQNDDELDVE